MSTTTWMYGKFEGFPLKFVKIVWVEEFIMTHDPCCWVPWLVFGGFSRFGATPFLQWGPRSSVFHGTVVLPCRLGGFAVGETQRKNGIRWVIGCIYIYISYIFVYIQECDLKWLGWNSLRQKVVEEYHSNFNEDLKTWSNTCVLMMPHEMFENKISTRTDAENWKPMVDLSSIQSLWLFAVFRGDYTTQLYRDYYTPW